MNATDRNQIHRTLRPGCATMNPTRPKRSTAPRPRFWPCGHSCATMRAARRHLMQSLSLMLVCANLQR
jgi:hypothetical protein